MKEGKRRASLVSGPQAVAEADGVPDQAVPRPDPVVKGERQAFSQSQDRSGQTDSMFMASSEDLSAGHTGEKWVDSEYYVSKPCLGPARETERERAMG